MIISNVVDLLKAQRTDSLQLIERIDDAEPENSKKQFLAVMRKGRKLYMVDHHKGRTDQHEAPLGLDALYEAIDAWCVSLKMSPAETAEAIADVKARFGLK